MATNNLTIAFASQVSLDVRHVSIREGMSELFHVSVLAVSSNDGLDLDSNVGTGAALRIQMPNYQSSPNGTRVWAGICANMSQVSAEPAPGLSAYHVLIMPSLWRTTLRTGSRIFQHMTTPAIVQKVLAEWKITPVMKLQAQYKTHEYCVQYGETDYAFICRLLEDAGIAFYFSSDATSGMGDDITKLVLNDSPQLNPQRSGPLTYAGTQTPNAASGQDWIANVAVTQKVTVGSHLVRDSDFRARPDMALAASAKSGTSADPYEDYRYSPGAFWWEPGQASTTPTADDKGVARTDMGEANALAQRRLDAERRARLTVTYTHSALDLCPGTIMGINQDADTPPHPRPDLGPTKTLLLVASSFDGDNSGQWSMTATGVFAEFTYRPERRTPRPRIIGVQSAIVVGPAGQEIYTDEFGRVRVQFPWDREGRFDDNSSCWMRVSQAWAGGGFGVVMIPRIGHEVLVDFFDGDPDRPVIIGRVYNATTTAPYTLPQSQTQSGWKSNSSPGGGGYNEIKFEDMAGSELISVQAQKDLSYVVNNNESSNIGSTRTVQIGSIPTGSDTLNVGATRTTSIGMTDTTWVGMMHSTTVGATVGIRMAAALDIVISTGQASIHLSGGNIFMNAKGEIHLHSGGNMHLSSQSGAITIQGGPNVQINPAGAGEAPQINTVSPGMPPTPASPGAAGTPPFLPSGGGSIPQPGGIQDVDVEPESGGPGA